MFTTNDDMVVKALFENKKPDPKLNLTKNEVIQLLATSPLAGTLIWKDDARVAAFIDESAAFKEKADFDLTALIDVTKSLIHDYAAKGPLAKDAQVDEK